MGGATQPQGGGGSAMTLLSERGVAEKETNINQSWGAPPRLNAELSNPIFRFTEGQKAGKGGRRRECAVRSPGRLLGKDPSKNGYSDGQESLEELDIAASAGRNRPFILIRKDALRSAAMKAAFKEVEASAGCDEPRHARLSS